MGLFSKSLKTAGVFLAVFSFSILHGQQNSEDRTAEKLFGKYHKFGLVLGGSLLFTTNEPNAINYKYKNLTAFNIGIEYNFYQIKRFNFKIAFLRRIYAIKETKRLRKEDIDSNFDVALETIFGDFLQSLIPITAEYIMPLNERLSLNLGLGPEFTIYPPDPTSGAFYVTQSNGTRIGSTEKGNSKDGWLYIGASASIGLNIETGPLLLRPTLTYHYQPETLFTNVVTTQNLMVSENTVSRHEITGNYLMISLSIIPSRDLFRSKEKKRFDENK